ncbi:uncharacterized protein LOC131634913 [Vicia villosa]|uniref:uncharacterized protein LOC131634913 n=1 Tax=Vicia villosa TaxID=3911 RepID=UPI00273CB9D6|nr:uncharacterized protein LOC131634913 [Vicia villosa]
MRVYETFMKKLISRKRNLKHDENIALAEECRAICQRKLPPKLTDLERFSIPCPIGSLTINHELCDLGTSINLMPLSMMRNLKCGKPKPIHMTLILVNCSIPYPYGVLEDVLVRVDGILFPSDYVIIDMLEDLKTPLLLRRSFLATGKALIDVALGESVIIFNKENFVFNMFEELKHHLKNPQCYQVSMVKEKPKKLQ